MNDLESIARLAMAMVLGGLIGLERERSNKAAGLRTLMLVSLGSALFALIGVGIVAGSEPVVLPGGGVGLPDPTRIVAGIVGGVGFLGAGAIWQGKGSV